MPPTILSHPLFVETILPFLLVFTVVFAVLQKSKILGDGKKQVDAIVSLVIGLIVISFGQATGYIIQIIPFLAVALVTILVFMILVGSFGKSGDGEIFGSKLKMFLTIAALIAVVIVVVIITGFWTYIYDAFSFGPDSTIFANVAFIVIIIGAIAAVIWGAGGSGKT